jgi:hypothetical protein
MDPFDYSKIGDRMNEIGEALARRASHSILAQTHAFLLSLVKDTKSFSWIAD